jgi:hypothetical protein
MQSPVLPASKGTVKKMLLPIQQRGAELLSYVLRYKVGYLYHREQRPYTMIVVARKSTT